MNYEDLLMEAEAEGLIVKEKPLKVSDGRIKGKRIAIRQDIPTYRQKSCVLAEELGHHHTTVGRIIEQDSVMDRKQERMARLWAYNKRIGLWHHSGLPKALPQPTRTGRVPGSVRRFSERGAGVLPRKVWMLYGAGWISDYV